MAANDFRFVSGRGTTVVMKANASTAINVGELVYLSSGLLTIANDSNTTGFVGVAAENIPVSTFGTVIIDGVFEGTAAAGVNFAPGDYVYSNGAAATKLDAGTAADLAVGLCVNTDPATAGAVQFTLHSICSGRPFVHA